MSADRQIRPLTWEEYCELQGSDGVFVTRDDRNRGKLFFKKYEKTEVPSGGWEGFEGIDFKDLCESGEFRLFSTKFSWIAVMQWLIDHKND